MNRTRTIRHLVFVVSALSSIVVRPSSAGENTSKLVAELQLTAIRNYMQLWDLGDCEQSAQFKKLTSQSTAEAVIIIKSASPSIADLDGKALESLCVLSENLHILDFANDKLTRNMAVDYLGSIDEEVRERIQHLQKSMKGQGCRITPENI